MRASNHQTLDAFVLCLVRTLGQDSINSIATIDRLTLFWLHSLACFNSFARFHRKQQNSSVTPAPRRAIKRHQARKIVSINTTTSTGYRPQIALLGCGSQSKCSLSETKYYTCSRVMTNPSTCPSSPFVTTSHYVGWQQQQNRICVSVSLW